MERLIFRRGPPIARTKLNVERNSLRIALRQAQRSDVDIRGLDLCRRVRRLERQGNCSTAGAQVNDPWPRYVGGALLENLHTPFDKMFRLRAGNQNSRPDLKE
jgi:hypothetical protein